MSTVIIKSTRIISGLYLLVMIKSNRLLRGFPIVIMKSSKVLEVCHLLYGREKESYVVDRLL